MEVEGQRVVCIVRSSAAGWLELEIDGRPVRVAVAGRGEEIWVAYRGRTYHLVREGASRKRSSHGVEETQGLLRAPMPGQVRAIQVSEGATVRRGETILVLEAMKMEIRIQAPGNGKVTRICVTVGQQVEKEHVLAEFAVE